MKQFYTKTIGWIAQIGSKPDDDHDVRLQKTLLVVCALPFMFLGFLWGTIYVYFGQPLAGAIPISYGFISLMSIVHFGFSGKYSFFRFSQLALIFLLPFLLMVALGGFVAGSAVVLWSLICPLGALLFDTIEHAKRWFFAFLGLVILSAILPSFVDSADGLSSELITLFFVMNIGGVGSLIFLMVFHFVGLKDAFQEKSEALLLNILPKEIADILRDENRTIADHFDGVSVLFADVAGFTSMSEQMSARELVSVLDGVFSHFDTMVEKYDLEKIKTIGDCYMVASGVPRARPDHAQVLARLAIEMRDYAASHEIQGHKLRFRIGLNSGPVVAGVIGQKKFIYDLWGDVVNTASRMESHGQVGEIQITQATYDLIEDEFVCKEGGTVEIKGKGAMEVWIVEH